VNVTNRGFEYICQWMGNTAATGTPYSLWTVPTYIGWGGANGYNTAATTLPGTAPSTTVGTGQWSDVAPYQEFSEARAAGTATTVNDSTGFVVQAGGVAPAYNGTVTTQITGLITAGAGENVAESFLAFTATKPSAFTLSGSLTGVTTATSLTVTSSGATAGGYYQVNNEVVYVTSTAASNVWTIVRACNGSSANTAKTGDIITNGNPPGYGVSNPNHADIFAHAGFIGLALNSGDSVSFTWVINVTS
jgi:hypothetical protein